MRVNLVRLGLFPVLLLSAACGPGDGEPGEVAADASAAAPVPLPACDPDDGGIALPEGFCALTVTDAELQGRARLRHIAVDQDGDIYVTVQGSRDAETPSARGGILALRDTTGDGRADVSTWFGPAGGTGMEIHEGHLYFATNQAVLRYPLGPELEPAGTPDTLVSGLPSEHSHSAKSLAIGGDGSLFVNIGSPTNACQPIGRDRERGAPGEDPCAQLETRAGVWRFSSTATGQTQSEGERWATGIRNAVALAWNPADGNLYAVQHGRDQLDHWPGFEARDNAEGPAEELQRLTRGADFGWPYCYYDTRLNRRVLAPEYGGDGQEVGRCADAQDPLIAFPAHWAPNDLLFYTGDQFPAAYRGGGFIAFHGSWNRAPFPQEGYRVAFVPFSGGEPSQDWQTFAEGFAGGDEIASPGDADHRPMGLAQGPDGTLYITDSAGGRIWRVVHRSR